MTDDDECTPVTPVSTRIYDMIGRDGIISWDGSEWATDGYVAWRAPQPPLLDHELILDGAQAGQWTIRASGLHTRLADPPQLAGPLVDKFGPGATVRARWAGVAYLAAPIRLTRPIRHTKSGIWNALEAADGSARGPGPVQVADVWIPAAKDTWWEPRWEPRLTPVSQRAVIMSHPAHPRTLWADPDNPRAALIVRHGDLVTGMVMPLSTERYRVLVNWASG